MENFPGKSFLFDNNSQFYSNIKKYKDVLGEEKKKKKNNNNMIPSRMGIVDFVKLCCSVVVSYLRKNVV